MENISQAPKFDINEKSLIICAKAMASVVASYCDGSESL